VRLSLPIAPAIRQNHARVGGAFPSADPDRLRGRQARSAPYQRSPTQRKGLRVGTRETTKGPWARFVAIAHRTPAGAPTPIA
jgi:hypothetical protein